MYTETRSKIRRVHMSFIKIWTKSCDVKYYRGSKLVEIFYMA
jgi:hypothetical protein